MKVDDIKDLEKIIKLCRKLGVDHIIVDGIEINLGPEPVAYRAERTTSSKAIVKAVMQTAYNPGIAYAPGEDVKIPTDALTDEQLLMWSVNESEQ